jgi:hypothetical protein
MADNEKGESFFRKVARFVTNPTTDWTEINTRQEDTRELDLEKSELKAMIERKRRNDFVRKREFDMLRRVRREGLSPEQLAALGGSSRLDDSEVRNPESNPFRPDDVKEKIDEIEQQMVGDGFSTTSRRGMASTVATPMIRDLPRLPELPVRPGMPGAPAPTPTPAVQPPLELAPAAAPSPVQMVATGLPPLAPAAAVSFGGPSTGRNSGSPGSASAPSEFGSPSALEVSEAMHDPELDEAVIAFANADFNQCEDALARLTSKEGARAQHAETWLVLFDLYRATGQQQRFESLAMDYAQQFGWSAPQWYSLPKLVSDAAAEDPLGAASDTTQGGHTDIGWICPMHLDIDAVGRLRSQTLQLPLPWVFDWGQLVRIDAEAAMQLSMLLRLWGGQALEMRWLAGDRLFAALQDAAPTGVRDADPAFWLTRLDALRLANRADQFDETAIDYCVTYEVSPPSWEPARCKVTISNPGLSTRTPALSMVSEVSTSFMESSPADDAIDGVEVAHVELSGQLVGDIAATLFKLNSELGNAAVVSVSCARLIRVDFLAAGDLLNWVLSKRTESRSVHFVDTHRLIALFFGAMGINEHAKVQVRKV